MPEATARLVAAMALDVALAEVAQSAPDPHLRAALLALLPEPVDS